MAGLGDINRTTHLDILWCTSPYLTVLYAHVGRLASNLQRTSVKDSLTAPIITRSLNRMWF